MVSQPDTTTAESQNVRLTSLADAEAELCYLNCTHPTLSQTTKTANAADAVLTSAYTVLLRIHGFEPVETLTN